MDTAKQTPNSSTTSPTGSMTTPEIKARIEAMFAYDHPEVRDQRLLNG